MGDNIWELVEVELVEGDEFKFVEMFNFMGKNFGDVDGDGVVEEFGNNIMFMGDFGIYKIIFNDVILEYIMEFLGIGGGGGFEFIGIIGSVMLGGWDVEMFMMDNGDGIYFILIGLLDGEVKFCVDNDWVVNWGVIDFLSGIGIQDGLNIFVIVGNYMVCFNVLIGEYFFE